VTSGPPTPRLGGTGWRVVRSAGADLGDTIEMRKQYHLRPGPGGLEAWDVDRLVELSADLPVVEVPLERLTDIETPYWFGAGDPPTVRAVVEHVRLIEAADPRFPIILGANGQVMDGMHRIARALLAGQSTIAAVQFSVDPAPDFINCDPEDLPYPE